MTEPEQTAPKDRYYVELAAWEASYSLYAKLLDWMNALPIAVEYRATYAMIFAMARTGRPISAGTLSKFLHKNGNRTVFRHLRALRDAGLIAPIAAFAPSKKGHSRKANSYRLLWNSVMGAGMKGALYESGGLEKKTSPVISASDTFDPGADVALAPEVVTQATDLINKQDKESKQDSKQVAPSPIVMRLPTDLQNGLRRASKETYHDCVRILLRWAPELPTAERDAAAALAVRNLIAACERSDVKNPPGFLTMLLRTSTAPLESSADVSCASVEELRHLEARLQSAASGEGFCRALRAWNKAYDELLAGGVAVGAAASGINLPAVNQSLAPLARDWLTAERARLAAARRDDGLARSHFNDTMYKIELQLDLVIKSSGSEAAE